MGVRVDMIPCHPGEPAWSAIDRVLGRGTSLRLDEDDPDAPAPLYDSAPMGWREEFVASVGPVADWRVRVDDGCTDMWTPNWRWFMSICADEVILSYRKTGPARTDDLADRAVIEVAARVGCVIYWPDMITWADRPWADLRVDRFPDDLG